VIATDSSSLVAYLAGDPGADVEQITAAVDTETLVLPPAVVTELLSDPKSRADIENFVRDIPWLAAPGDYWIRAGHSRRILKGHGRKAKLADALIAQSCIDHDVALITRDDDFRHFAKHCGLKFA